MLSNVKLLDGHKTYLNELLARRAKEIEELIKNQDLTLARLETYRQEEEIIFHLMKEVLR